MPIGELEEKILWAILQLENDTYGSPIREELEKAGRRISVGALYITLERLETKGLLEGREGEVQNPRGGRPRRFFQVTAEGIEALRASESVRSKLTRGLNLKQSLA